jgi:hypothetical protein
LCAGGWLQLLDNDTLEGEFMGALGRFRATRQPPAHKAAETSRRKRSPAKRRG